MSLIDCCCETPPPTNPCNCTWPRNLNFYGTVTQSQASFYFDNQYTGPGAPTEPQYDLVWQARPSDIPKNLDILYYASPGAPPVFVMPDEGWFSSPISGTNFTNPITIYFYMWVQGCTSHVMIINCPYSIGTVPDDSAGAGENIQEYALTSCTPFQMKQGASPVLIWGTHGADDIVPDSLGTAGKYTLP